MLKSLSGFMNVACVSSLLTSFPELCLGQLTTGVDGGILCQISGKEFATMPEYQNPHKIVRQNEIRLYLKRPVFR